MCRMVLGLRENSKWGIVEWLMIRKPQLRKGETGEVVGQDFGSQAVSEGAIQAGETRLEMTFKFPHVGFQLFVGLLSSFRHEMAAVDPNLQRLSKTAQIELTVASGRLESGNLLNICHVCGNLTVEGTSCLQSIVSKVGSQ